MKKVHVKRFIGFLGQIEKCPKVVVSQLLIHVKQDVRSNSKKIMLLSGKTRVEEVDQSDATKPGTIFDLVLLFDEAKKKGLNVLKLCVVSVYC